MTESAKYEVKTFDLDQLDVGEERSKYPFEDMQVGQGFAVDKPTSAISSRVSSFNKKSEKVFVTRKDKDSTTDNPKSWVIRVK
jgi:hypothetical protein